MCFEYHGVICRTGEVTFLRSSVSAWSSLICSRSQLTRQILEKNSQSIMQSYQKPNTHKTTNIITYIQMEARERTEKLRINKKCGNLSVLKLDVEI